MRNNTFTACQTSPDKNLCDWSKSHCRQPIRAHKTYDIRFCFGVQIQTQKKHHSLTYAAERPSKALTRRRLIRADDHVKSTTQKQQTFNNPSDKINSLAYHFSNLLSSLNNSLTTLALHYFLHFAFCIMFVIDIVENTSFCWSVVSCFPCHNLLCLFCPSNCYTRSSLARSGSTW